MSGSDRIDRVFERQRIAGRTVLIPYVTAGDPSLATTAAILDELAGAGADIIELGVPFSDPMADGPVVQRASERALAQGVGLRDVLDLVSQFRKRNTHTPVVLMGYANPVEAMGAAAFGDRARDAGVDGVIVVDYPPEEASEFAALLRTRDIAPIFLIAPTTPQSRIERIGSLAAGYVYYVSLKGVTGAGHLEAVLERLTATIREAGAARKGRSGACRASRCRSALDSGYAMPIARAPSRRTPTPS